MLNIAAKTHSADLAALGADLVRMLGGRWDARRSGGMCLCPVHADRSPSLSVRVGDKALLFHCFAGCDNRGVIRAIAHLAPDALGRGMPTHVASHTDWLGERIKELWDCALPLSDTPAERYLRKRGLAQDNPALRYHPRTPLGPKGKVVFRPALLTAVTQGSTLVALQRTFLDSRGARRARDLRNPRRMLGQPGRGCVRLDLAGDMLGVAEGMESAFSAMLLLGFPVWAALGNERLAQVAIPAAVRRLILLADNDRAGHIAVAAARRAHERNGRSIEIWWPWRGMNDWNDVLREELGLGA